MKILKFAPLRFSMLIAFALLYCLSACSKKVTFQTSRAVPAAEGYVKISKDDNKNYTIDVNVKRLAEPSRLQPPKEVYVVWMESEGNGVKNLGILNSSSGFFSSGLKALLHAVTPFKPQKVFVTAEDKSNITFSGSQVVLTTKAFN